MPAPRWRICLPDWMPAGMRDLVLRLVEPRHLDLAAQRRGREADRAAREQRGALALEDRVPGDVDEDVEIARRPAAHARLALARQADARAFVDAGGNVDRERLALVDAPLAPAGRAGIGDRLADAAALRAGLLDHEEALLRADLAAAAAHPAAIAAEVPGLAPEPAHGSQGAVMST